ncbi:hypothetical protein ACLOJK_029527 [Asimina triloba]
MGLTLSSYDFIKEATLKRMRYLKDEPGTWIYKYDNQGTPSQASKELPHPSIIQIDVNVKDYLVDPETNMVEAGPSFRQSGGNDDFANAVPSEFTQPVSPGGVQFYIPSTATSRPTMSFSSMPSSFQFLMYQVLQVVQILRVCIRLPEEATRSFVNPEESFHYNEAHIRRFKNGLNESIRDMMMVESCKTYGKAIDQAMWVEKMIE